MRHKISIHAPREGSDLGSSKNNYSVRVISIHAPREGSDKGRQSVDIVFAISIHAPREGSDQLLTP